jgi:Protein of unknown function (DUF4231)
MADTQLKPTPEEVTLQRLDDQIAWYGQKSSVNQRRFKLMKGITIASAAAIPVLTTTAIPDGRYIAAGLGVLIAVVEGLQQMNQYHSNWTAYRSTSESLKHEKYLYLAKAGPYLSAQNPQGMLAERIESLISQEGSKWLSVQSPKPQSDNPPER